MRVLAVLGLAAAVAGCGWSEPPGPQQAVWEYRAARLAGDPVRSCAALSSRARAALERSYGRPCPHAGHAYSETEPINVRRWAIRSVAVHGDRAVVRLAPGRHIADRRLNLVREAGGWKLERTWREMTERSGWAHCVAKLTADADRQRLDADARYAFAERHCERPPREGAQRRIIPRRR
jgi:hypothetical protein